CHIIAYLRHFSAIAPEYQIRQITEGSAEFSGRKSWRAREKFWRLGSFWTGLNSTKPYGADFFWGAGTMTYGKFSERSRLINMRLKGGHGDGGFTLLEALLVVIMIGLLTAIAAPGFLGFLQLRRISGAQRQSFAGIRLAQKNAIQRREEWQFSIRDDNDRLSFAVHPRSVAPADHGAWELLPEGVKIDDETTLATGGGVRYVRFGHNGQVTYRLSRVTFSGRNGGSAQRCVIVSTLIGATRLGKDHRYPQDGKYCY
ncbi:MAG: GspH/FimT family pseudopilin, partial [Cyanobacteria bacterium P01_D01_bin.128]